MLIPIVGVYSCPSIIHEGDDEDDTPKKKHSHGKQKKQGKGLAKFRLLLGKDCMAHLNVMCSLL
jgi:hypothetical protein